MRVVVCLYLCLFFLPGIAGATSIVFDFTLPSDDFSYQFADISLQVDAYAEIDNIWSAVSITQTTTNGLGVSSKGGDDSQFENVGPDEALFFSFSQIVGLQQVVFSLVDAGDQFNLDVDGLPAAGPIEIWSDQNIALIDKTCSYDFDLEGRVFAFSLEDSSDKFRIQSLTVDLLPVPTPEPSTWSLLSFGVAVLFWQRKRQTG